MKHSFLLGLLSLAATTAAAQDLQLNDLGYFERQGVNVLVFSNNFNGGFNDEKNSGIEVIHHGVRTISAPGTSSAPSAMRPSSARSSAM